MIHVVAEITVKDGQRDAFIELLQKLVPQVRAEEGCLAYGPALDLETGVGVQAACRPNVVSVFEQWESVEALKVHLGMPHMDEFRASVADLVDDLKIRVCQPV